MKLSVNAQDLNDALNVVTRALAARAAKPILEGVLMDAQPDGKLVLQCSDGKVSIESTITADIEETGSAVLPGRLFNEIVRKLPGGMVSISVNDSMQAEIRCARSRTKLTGMSAMEYPEMADVNPEKAVAVKLPQIKLKNMINGVIFAVATDESRQILTGCLMEVTANEAKLVTLDGFRLAIQSYIHDFDLPEGQNALKAVIPGRVMTELGRILADEEAEVELSFDSTHMSAVFGNNRLSTSLLAGEYIDYQRILPGVFKTTILVNRTSILEALELASIMAKEGKNNLVKFHIVDNNLHINSNAEVGDQGYDVDIDMNGDPLDIAFNAKYITDAIRPISDEMLCLNFNSSVSPCVFKPVEGGQYIYLILPVRVF